MQTLTHRRSARIAIHIPIEVSGLDVDGRYFHELARTESISEHGGCLLLSRPLELQQELHLRRPHGRETIARVIGEVRRTGSGILYGIGFQEGSFDFWGIHFPASALKSALFRVLLECVQCANREVVALNDFQLETLDLDASLARECNVCGKRTSWVRTEYEGGRIRLERVSAHSPAAKSEENRRKALRARLQLLACIRKPGSEEVVSIVDVSRGGLRFRSVRSYVAGSWVQVAVPFTKDAANIFVPAQVVWQEPAQDAQREYGLKYVK